MFFSTAQAQTAAPAAGGDFLVSMLPLILIFVVFYFLLIRPQQQRMKKHRSMIDAVKRGDEVVTAGGIYGKVTRVEDLVVTVQIAKDVDVKVAKATLTDVINKTLPPAGNDNAKATGAGGFMNKLLGKK